MSVLGIRIWPDPVLFHKSVPVDPTAVAGGHYDQLVADMFDTLYDARGIGLAAVQVAALYRLFVMDVHAQYVFFNPVIVGLQGTPQEENEGCLSLPGVVERVPRYAAIRVRYTDRAGEAAERDFTGLEAQCVQHETEHLDGITIPDKIKMGAMAREKLRRQLAKGR